MKKTRDKKGKFVKGHPTSIKMRKKISKTLKQTYKENPEIIKLQRKKQSEYYKKHPEKKKEQIRKAIETINKNPERKKETYKKVGKKTSLRNIENWKDKEYRVHMEEKLRQGRLKDKNERLKNPFLVEERNKKRKETFSKDPNVIRKIKEARAKQIIPVKDTTIEVKIQNFLKQLEIEFFTHQYMKIEHGYQCDILIPVQKRIPQKTIIECDGDFFHMNPKKYPSNYVIFPNSKNKKIAKEVWQLDDSRTKELIEKGFKVLRLWGDKIKVMKLNEFQEKLYVI